MNQPSVSAANSKPKLVFFKFRYSAKLTDFLLTHAQEHVKCLSHFFDVTVIQDDCDYEEVCDRHQPDLTLFESGVNISVCRRPEITNIGANSKIPRVGFLNADAWCETRSGTLAEMDRWGIETFFSISVIAAEHLPEVAGKLYAWPNSIDSDVYRDYGAPKVIPVLITGSAGPQYPWRRRVFKKLSKQYPSLLCPHHGYVDRAGAEQVLYGERYARTINASLVAPACGTIAKEVVRKHFEIPACGACMITEDSPGLRAAGFADMQNCVMANESDVLDKLDYLFSHPEELAAITRAGYELVHSRHTMKHRDQLLQWFRLHQSLKPGERIVQTSPFGMLASITAPNAGNGHIVSNGGHFVLLRQADEKLSSGKYPEAERLYLKCLNYMRRLPEPQMKLALCNLLQGKARMAMHWVSQPLQYTLAEYRAYDPDPVEWAYLIVSLLCMGRLDAAVRRSLQFQHLRHPELDRARQATAILSGRFAGSFGEYPATDYRASVHQLPSLSDAQWREQLRRMLTACGQLALAESLTERASKAASPIDGRSASAPTNQGDRKEALRMFERRLLYSKVRRRAKTYTDAISRRMDAMFGRFVRSGFAHKDTSELFQAIQDLVRGDNVRSVLIIGASADRTCTKAVIDGVLNNPHQTLVYCIRCTGQPLAAAFPASKGASVQWQSLSDHSSELCSEALEQTIAKIKREAQIDAFDIVVVDGSQITHALAVSKQMNDELRSAGCVVLEDVHTVENHLAYAGLLDDPEFRLTRYNCDLPTGYAVFEKEQIAGLREDGVLCWLGK
jgi:hypothetical protein